MKRPISKSKTAFGLLAISIAVLSGPLSYAQTTESEPGGKQEPSGATGQMPSRVTTSGSSLIDESGEDSQNSVLIVGRPSQIVNIPMVVNLSNPIRPPAPSPISPGVSISSLGPPTRITDPIHISTLPYVTNSGIIAAQGTRGITVVMPGSLARQPMYMAPPGQTAEPVDPTQ